MVINKKALTIGFVALFLTSLVYLIDRPTENTFVLNNLGIKFPYNRHVIFGLLGPFIPSFGHAFSFSLISASLIYYNTSRIIIICTSWFLINAIFEVAQLIRFDIFNSIPLLDNFTKNGTFDPIDLISAGFGSLVAFYLLQSFNHRKKLDSSC